MLSQQVHALLNILLTAKNNRGKNNLKHFSQNIYGSKLNAETEISAV